MVVKSVPLPVLKYASLVTLTLQNALLGISLRYARIRSGDMFLSSTAVVMSEIVKLLMSLLFVLKEEGNVRQTITSLHNNIVKQPFDMLRLCIPSIVYIIQNNLLYVSASHLDVATYQVTYQLKILTTAAFAVIILRRSLLFVQWMALVILVLGVVLVQLEHKDTHVTNGIEQNQLIGFSAAIAASFLSGFAGIYFEKILKGSDISLWIRNVQLSLLSLPFGIFACLASNWNNINVNGFFFGYDGYVIYLVLLQAGGGLVISVVMKYADNILKGFASSQAIIISCIASVYLFDFEITMQFTIGAVLVICSIFAYCYRPKMIIVKTF